MNLDSIITRVKRTFGDESGVQLTDDDILRFVSDAQRSIVTQNEEVLTGTNLQNIVAGTDQYSFPTDLLVLRTVRIKIGDMETYGHLRHLNRQAFDLYISGHIGVGEGTPSIYTTYDRTIFLFPIPDRAATNGLQILYNKRPTDVTATTDTLSVPEEYHNAIVSYCLMRTNQMDEDYEISAIHQAEFTNEVRLLSFQQQMNPYETYPTITVSPDDF